MSVTRQYTIKWDDVGKSAADVHVSLCQCCGAETLEFVFESLGIVQARDVGKRCYKVGDVWQVENEEQFWKRLDI